jgi:hypothetical protein
MASGFRIRFPDSLAFRPLHCMAWLLFNFRCICSNSILWMSHGRRFEFPLGTGAIEGSGIL